MIGDEQGAAYGQRCLFPGLEQGRVAAVDLLQRLRRDRANPEQDPEHCKYRAHHRLHPPLSDMPGRGKPARPIRR
jgi:hypothetical protein